MFLASLAVPLTPSRALDLPRTVEFLSELARDINGDGVSDHVEAVSRGQERIVALDGRTGSTLWASRQIPRGWGSADPDGRISSPTLLDCNSDGLRDFLFVSSDGSRTLVAVDHASGRTLWTHRSGSSLLVQRRSKDDRRYGGARWAFDFLAIDGVVLVADRGSRGRAGGGLLALDPATGEVAWRAQVDLGDLKQGLNSRRLIAGDRATLEIDSGGFEVGLSATGRVLVLPGRFLSAGNDGIVALDARSGDRIWTWRPSRPNELREPALLDCGGYVLLCAWPWPRAHTGERLLLAAVDPHSGRELWWRDLAVEERFLEGRGKTYPRRVSFGGGAENLVRVEASSSEIVLHFGSYVFRVDAQTGAEASRTRYR